MSGHQPRRFRSRRKNLESERAFSGFERAQLGPTNRLSFDGTLRASSFDAFQRRRSENRRERQATFARVVDNVACNGKTSRFDQRGSFRVS